MNTTTDRVNALVKAAAMRIVPAGQYATGKAKQMAEEAIKKLKAPKGFGGADLSTKSSKFFKEASDKSKEVAGAALVTGATAANGAALGYIGREDMASKRVRGRDAIKTTQAAQKGVPIEKNLMRSDKRLRRMKPAIGRVSRKAGVVGGLVGAALGGLAARDAIKKKRAMEKTAGRAVVPHKATTVMPKGHQLAEGVKDVSPKAVLRRRFGKGAAAAGALAAAAAVIGHQKKASRKDGKGHLSVTGAAVAGAGIAAHNRLTKDGTKIKEGLKKQVDHIKNTGGRIAPIDVKMAIDSFKKPLARRAGKAALKGGAIGGLAAAGLNKLMDNHKANARAKYRMQKQAETVGSQGDQAMKKVVASNGKKGSMALQPGSDKKPVKTSTKSKNPLAKQAAEMIERNGKKYRKGNTISAAATMAGVNAGMDVAGKMSALSRLRAAGMPAPARMALSTLPHSLVGGAVMGGVYGGIRNHFRKKRGEISTSHADFAKLKAGK